MPIDKPKAGRCNAKLGDLYCGNYVVPGTERCVPHGGAASLLKPLKESLYTQRLRACFPNPEDQQLFDEIPKHTNLEEEIRVCRMQIVKLQHRLENGEEFIYTDKANHKPLVNQIAEDATAQVQAKVTEGAKSIRDLLESHLDTLRRLCATQADLRPGSEIGGNLRISIHVAGERKTRAPLPDLTSDPTSPSLLPPSAGDSTVDVVATRTDGRGYDADE